MIHGSDWLLSGYASRQWIVDSIHEYRSGPLWNPNVFSGLPAPNPYTALTLLYLILPVHVAWTYLFVLSIFLAGLGTYLYLKELKLDMRAALLGGIAYMGCGSLLSMTQPGHDGKILAAGLFPFILLFLHKALTRGKLSYFLFAGAIGGIAAVHAHFQLAYYAAVASGFYLLTYLVWDRRQNGLKKTAKLIGYAALAVALAGGLAAIKFIPIFGSFGWGSRGAFERGYEFATSWSLPPAELLDLLTPHFSGILNNYWGENYFKLDTQYIGILPLLLALLGILLRIKERWIKFFLATGIVATVFSLGGYTPLYRIPYYLLPQVSKFRGPAMAFYLTAFSVVVLGAFGLHAAMTNAKSRRTLVLSLSIVFVGVLIFTLVCTGAKDSILGSLRSYLEPKLTTAYGPQLAQQKMNNLYENYSSFLRGLGISLSLIAINSVIIVLLSMRRLKWGTPLFVALCLFLLLDQWSIEKKYLRAEAPPETYYAPDQVVRFLKGAEEDIHRVFPLIYEHAQDGYLMHHGIQSVGGYVANPGRRYQQLIGAGESVMFNPSNLVKHRTLLDILNVKYIVGVWIPQDLSEYDENTQQMIENFKLNFGRQWGISWEEFHEGLTPVFSTEVGYAVYRNETALPRVWFVPDYRVLAREDVLEYQTGKDFNPRRVVVLEVDPGVPHGDSLPAGDATVTRYQPNRITCEVNAHAPGFLVLSENWHPDWKAYVDGEKSTILVGNYALRALVLEQGEHEVTFICDSPHFRSGAWTSLSSFLVLVAITVVWGMNRRRHTKK